MDSKKELEEILATIKRLEKAGTLEKFLASAPDLPVDEHTYMPGIDTEDGYRDISNECNLMVARSIKLAEEHLSVAKFYSHYVRKMYEDYKSREGEIKHPIILKFIKDYEEEQRC